VRVRINVVTIFPEFFSGPLGLSIPSRAAAAGSVSYNIIDLRDFTHDKHRTVDDYPYGGGAGMVMKPQPFFEAVESLDTKPPIVLLSPRGRIFAHADAERFAGGEELTLLCGHYKDIDQRVADHLATEEISLGDFVLSGGEAAALGMLGLDAPPSRAPWVYTEFAGQLVDIVGWAPDRDEERILGDPRTDSFAVAYLRGDRVAQLAVVNGWLPAEQARAFVESRATVGELARLVPGARGRGAAN